MSEEPREYEIGVAAISQRVSEYNCQVPVRRMETRIDNSKKKKRNLTLGNCYTGDRRADRPTRMMRQSRDS